MPAEAPEEKRPWRAQFRRGLAFIRPDAGRAVLVLVVALILAAVNALEPLVLKFIFDGFTRGEFARPILLGIALLFGLAVMREAFGAFSNWVNWRVRLKVHARMLDTTVGRLHTLPLSFHKENQVGATMTRLDRGIQGFMGALAEFTFNILPAAAYLIMAVIIMVTLDWRLTLLVLFFAPIPAFIGAWAAREQTVRERLLMDRWSSVYSRFNEVLSGITVVKSFAMEDAEKRRFMDGVRGANQLVERGVGRDSSFGAARNLVAAIARIATIGVGGYLIFLGQITLGTLIAFLGYIGGLFGPVQGLTGSYQTIRRAAVSLDTVYSILDAQDSLGDRPDAVDVERLRGEVEFRDVSFRYSTVRNGHPVLYHVSFRVEPGQKVALVGPSGSGKSTVMSLLQRLYDPETGVVLVDGIDLRDVRQKALRRRVGVVLQDPVLLNDTVRNVIAYGRPEASQEEVEEVARAANAHDFILRLPDGYETMVGERGGRFSGGERQRIAIARALLKDPDIIILDEATSALDAETEALVQEAIDRLTRGRTTFIVAHRLATVVGADRIMVLKSGTVVEDGSHEALMAQGGYYATLVQHQTKGLMPRADPRP